MDCETKGCAWADGKKRCFWANPKNERYIAYHDHEWGVPVRDDRKLFEMLLLECFQRRTAAKKSKNLWATPESYAIALK